MFAVSDIKEEEMGWRNQLDVMISICSSTDLASVHNAAR